MWCGGQCINIAQHYFGVPQDLLDPGYMVALLNLIEAWNACVNKKRSGIFVT